MAIKIEMIDDSLLLVNHKEVRYDMNGNWVASGFHPSLEEANAVAEFILTKSRYPRLTKLEMTFE